MKKILALIILAALILPCMTAFAATETKVYVWRTSVTVYAKKSTSSKKIGTLYLGQKATCLNYDDDSTGWAKLKNSKGKVGYCKMSQVSDNNSNRLDATLRSVSGAKVKSAPSDSAKTIAKLSGGVKVRVVAVNPSCTWWRVKNGSKYGYMRIASLTGGEKKYFTGTNISIDGSSGKQVTLLSYGEKVLLLAKDGERAVIRRVKDGKTGWVRTDDFSSSNPCDKNAPGYVLADGVALYSKSQGIVDHKIKILSRGKKVTVLGGGMSVGYYRVKVGSTTGYIFANCLSDAKPDGDPVMRMADDIDLYKGKLNGEKIGELEKGEKVLLLEVKNLRAKVKTTDGLTGWCLLSLLRVDD